jgi:hypothetical protein
MLITNETRGDIVVPEVQCVSWWSPTTRAAYQLTVKGCELIWPVARQRVHFRDNRIIHPAIGTAVKKSKTFRARLSSRMQRLKAMWEIIISGGSPIGLECSVCFACNSTDDETEPIVACAVCLNRWHQSCCKHVVDAMASALGSEAVQHASARLPREFTEQPSSICQACSAILN